MSLFKRVLVAGVLLAAAAAPRSATGGDRETCLESCRQAATDCETKTCGTGGADSDCSRSCGDLYKQCKESCPQ